MGRKLETTRMILAGLAGMVLLAACGSSGSGDRQRITLDFTDPDSPDVHGWEAGFSDYAPEQEEIMEFASGHEPLPGELEGEGHGLMVGATNRSDDVFMYWAGPVLGLAPETSYSVRFTVEFATDTPQGCSGIGGAPDAVWMKAGISTTQPEPFLDDEDGHWRMNIDKGAQNDDGEDAIRIGTIGNENSGCLEEERVWEFKTLESKGKAFILETDAGGMAWLIVGTDSGFEGRTELFYTRLEVELVPR